MSEVALISGRVLSVEAVHDYYQLKLEMGGTLNIFNPVSMRVDQGNDISNMVGRVITLVSVGESAIELFLEDGEVLSISLLERDFNGPEAMQFIKPNGEQVVWQ